MANYDHLKIEKKWQKEWDKQKTYKTESLSKKKKFYVLDMFPYPSGVGLHVGHPRGYIGSDIYARVKRMQNYNVLHPMGYDAFGLPAEQYAIEHNIEPRKAVEKNVATFERQLSIMGLSYDWSRRVNTTDPEFYRWTQWIFLKMYNSWYNIEKDRAEPIETLIKKFAKEKHNDKTLDWKNKSEKEQQDILMNYRLAYEGYALVNWCPKLGTVLANDEIVDTPDGPVSERGGYPVIKKSMRQMFMRITSYAEKLLSGLDDLNWSEHIKEIQRNWIGKSEGVNLRCKIKDLHIEYEAYDSVPQTYMAQTFTIIAPEHPLVKKLVENTEYEKPVMNFVEIIKKKKLHSDFDNVRDMEGIFTGRYVWYEPAQKELPIWVSSFAVMDYGTGIVNCSAHDERDYSFAKKYNIPLHEVVEPLVVQTSGEDAFRNNEPVVERDAVVCVIKHWSEDKYLCLNWKKIAWKGFVIGGIENNETLEDTAKREIREETGYKNIRFIKSLPKVHSKFYQSVKKQNRFAHFHPVYVELVNEDREGISKEESALHDIVWVSKKEVESFVDRDELKRIWANSQGIDVPTIKNGILLEPIEFKGREWNEVREDIIDYLVNKGYATRKVNYKMRDAVFARQRYWGEPIPLRYDKEGIIHPLKDKDLPLELPHVRSYQPLGTGESPLAGVSSWVKHGYETNTMPGWAGSSWYFLRYMDPKNKKAFADKKALKYWKDVDMYVGGAEHATGHLLYSRFWHKFLYDLGLVPTSEPFKTLKNQGLIGGADGRKMSKRWGNVINPDDIVKLYGADTLRVYEMFMGPFDQSLPWSTESIIGSRRFLEKVWKLRSKLASPDTDLAWSGGMSKAIELTRGPAKSVSGEVQLQKLLHKTIKKVSEDIESFNFNTAISSMMIFLNEAEKVDQIALEDYKKFLQILAPFAPHITEELWHELGEKSSIHKSKWPVWDKNKIIDDEIKIAIQVNGKVRAELMISKDLGEEEIKAEALKDKAVIPWIEKGEIKRVIYVPMRLVNIVVA